MSTALVGVVALAYMLRAEMRLVSELTEDLVQTGIAHTEAEREVIQTEELLIKQRKYIRHLETQIVNDGGPVALADLIERVLQDYPG